MIKFSYPYLCGKQLYQLEYSAFFLFLKTLFPASVSICLPNPFTEVVCEILGGFATLYSILNSNQPPNLFFSCMD